MTKLPMPLLVQPMFLLLQVLKKLGIDDIVHFDFMDPPAPETVVCFGGIELPGFHTV